MRGFFWAIAILANVLAGLLLFVSLGSSGGGVGSSAFALALGVLPTMFALAFDMGGRTTDTRKILASLDQLTDAVKAQSVVPPK